MHQSDAGAVDGGAVIKIDALDKRAGAVSNADNGDSYFSHFQIVKAEKLPEFDYLEQRHKLGRFNLNSCACLAAAPSVASAECVRSRARLQELI